MKYHFIGDQGVSMRGLKKYLSAIGQEVSGSDLKIGGHKKENITSDIDIVVRTSAVDKGSKGYVEVLEAKNKNIKVIKRSELLGQIIDGKEAIAVSGAHGKTTVTTMIGLLLVNANFDPTVFVGEKVKEFGDEVTRIGKSNWFVFEACEYDRSFLDFRPKIAIVTNIEEEHLDTYHGGIEEIKEAFKSFLDNVPDDGLIIACFDDENVREVVSKTSSKAKVVYYGFHSEKYNSLDFDLKIPGKHNILNALAVLALADHLKIKKEIFKQTLTNFSGARSRFEYIGQYQGADLIDDYAHHPTEIKCTLEALNQRYPDKKKYVVFWPHQNRRTNHLFHDFVAAFDLADDIIIKPVYFIEGRDEAAKYTSVDLVNELKKRGKVAQYLENDDEIADYLRSHITKDSVLLTMGAVPTATIAKKLT